MAVAPTDRYRRLAMPGDCKASYIPVDHDGWLKMDGRTITQATYPALWKKVGLTTTSIILPDMKDRVLLGAGGVATVGATGGTNELTILIENLPEHDHGYVDTMPDVQTDKGGLLTGLLQVLKGVGSKTSDKTTKKTGGGKPVKIPTPPYLALNLFIFGG